MDEEIIDTVRADQLERGDLIRDYTMGNQIREISGVWDAGEEIHIILEDDDEPLVVSPDDEFNLYGYPIVEV